MLSYVPFALTSRYAGSGASHNVLSCGFFRSNRLSLPLDALGCKEASFPTMIFFVRFLLISVK
jgi:hypothetical protein